MHVLLYFSVQLFDQLLPTFGVYLRKVCEDEPHLIPFSAYYNSLRAIVPVIDAVAASLPPSQSACCCSSGMYIFWYLLVLFDYFVSENKSV